jgi:hypothetical protein
MQAMVDMSKFPRYSTTLARAEYRKLATEVRGLSAIFGPVRRV